MHNPLAFILLCLFAFLASLSTVKKVDQRVNSHDEGKKRDPPRWFFRLVLDINSKCKRLWSANDSVLTKPVEDTNYILCREQTEEWKGWMQLIFLWYHYFHVHEIYTLVRVCIASYVWLTGFGNFRYFHTTKDLSIRRLMRVMWRINFFPMCLGLTLQNQWMLYYICALHSVFTVFSYLILKIDSRRNLSSRCITCKIIIALCLSIIIWGIIPRNIFDHIWLPLRPLLFFQHVKGSRQNDLMYEWFFRSRLDHLIWIFGIVIAFTFPIFQRHISWLGQKRSRSLPCSAAVTTILLMYWWVYLRLDKTTYNIYHPYVSIVPVLGYITLRNLFPYARRRYIFLFQQIGKISLECYLAQMHIWMGTHGPNGSAEFTLHLLPTIIPRCVNFLIFSVFHLFCSYRIFQLTEVLKNSFIPLQ